MEALLAVWFLSLTVSFAVSIRKTGTAAIGFTTENRDVKLANSNPPILKKYVVRSVVLSEISSNMGAKIGRILRI
jgi:hypothetical protein